MSSNPGTSRFMQALEEKRRRDAALKPKVEPVETFDEDVVPADEYKRTEGEIQLDQFVDSIGILEAYDRWCGKMKPVVRPGQRESIKVSCPNPAHPDKNPSAWINLDKNTGICRPCGDLGFDPHDLAAWAMGFPVPDYKRNGDFPKLRKLMAESFGMRVERTLGGKDLVYKESEPETDKSDTSDESAETGKLSPEPRSSDISDETTDKTDKTDLSETPGDGDRSDSDTTVSVVEELYEDEDEYTSLMPTLAWREIVPGTDTFLDRYMEACCKDEAPEEYHFFNGLIALGFAAGREVTLLSKMPVFGNLFLCHLGKTGSGKSTAARHLKSLLRQSMPYDPNDPNNKGVDSITPASAETLIKAFSKPIYDPTDPKRIAFYAPVRGLVDYSEMSGLIGRASRQGNILKPTLMDFYDMSHEVRTQSNTGGKIIAENPFCSTTTTAQPAALRDLLREGDDASGFLNRWVFVGGVPKKSTIMGTGRVDLTAASEALDSIKGWTASFKAGEQVIWSKESLAAMQDFFDNFIYPLRAKPDTDIFVRMDLLCLKLTLLLSINKMEKMVTVDTVNRVKGMLTYLMTCYGIPADQIGNSLEHEMTEAIIYQMKRVGKKDGATLNAIALALKRRKYPKELILRNIKALIELGFVEEITSTAGNKGRPTKKYRYVAA